MTVVGGSTGNPRGIGQVLDAPEPRDGMKVSSPNRQGNGRLPLSRRKASQDLPGNCPPVLLASRRIRCGRSRLARTVASGWSDTIPSDYSWMRPNRRHVWSGLFLPGVISEGAGEIAIAVDCSGSVSRRQLGLFQAEVRSILEAQRPSLVHVLYFDTEVHKAETIRRGEPLSHSDWRGGTNFGPALHG